MITLKDFIRSESAFVILGVGHENKQYLQWLITIINIKYHRIIIADKNIEVIESIKKEYNYDFVSYSGDNYMDFLADAFIIHKLNITHVFKTPGIWSLSEELTGFRILKGEDSVLSPLCFFFEKYKNNIIGITGTKGKSTTSTATQMLLVDQGIRSVYAGNSTNISPYQYWNTTEYDCFVLELSSFQLQDLACSKFAPHIYAITNLYVDHLDIHNDINEYHSAKTIILSYQERGDYFITNQETFNKISTPVRSNTILIDSDVQEFNNIYKTELKGLHSRYNLITAINILKLVKNNYNKEIAISSIANFTGVPHRLQKVRTLVRGAASLNFYDDGAATEPAAVVAAIKSLTINEKLILIITGKDKGVDISELIKTINNTNNIILTMLGSAIGKRVFDNIKNGDNIIIFNNMKSILEYLSEYLSKTELTGTVNISLSPCGSSFDEFSNYIERSIVYTKWVNDLFLD
jgi:UDP-N-acetylmuramoyl-L-alanine---L-glutamate ligase